MDLVSRAADSIAEGDLVEKGIRSGMNWSLLPTAAIFCSVLPGEYMAGFLTGQIQFPNWLGKNSRRGKMDRILSELQSHTRLTAGVSKGAVTLDYGQRLREHIVSPMSKAGADGVDQSVVNINGYNLLREDLDGLMEFLDLTPEVLVYFSLGFCCPMCFIFYICCQDCGCNCECLEDCC